MPNQVNLNIQIQTTFENTITLYLSFNLIIIRKLALYNNLTSITKYSSVNT